MGQAAWRRRYYMTASQVVRAELCARRVRYPAEPRVVAGVLCGAVLTRGLEPDMAPEIVEHALMVCQHHRGSDLDTLRRRNLCIHARQ